jgi:hypothetical protein
MCCCCRNAVADAEDEDPNVVSHHVQEYLPYEVRVAGSSLGIWGIVLGRVLDCQDGFSVGSNGT